MSKIPIIIDCDPGLDDLFGIQLAAQSEQLDIKAITLCAGKESAAHTFANGNAIVSYLKLETRLARGSERAVILRDKPVWHQGGDNGMCDVRLAKGTSKFDQEYAWDVIYDEAVKAQGELIVVAFGPMTNLAIALYKYEDLKEYIKKIIFVGGSYDFGNYTSVSEINMATDPDAARTIFRSGIPMEMIGYNCTKKAALTVEQSGEICKEIDGYLGEIFEVSCHAMLKHMGGIYMDACLAIGSLMDEELVHYQSFYATIENKSSICLGRTTPLTMYAPRGYEKNIKMAMDINMDLYIEMLKQGMRNKLGAKYGNKRC